MTHLLRSLCVMTGLLAATAALGARGQAWAGLQAGWADLATWNRIDADAREHEVGLGLHLSGADGTVLVAFIGRLSATAPTRPPGDIVVQIGAGDYANPNLVRRPTLSFVLDEGNTEKKTVIDASGSLALDSLAPGDAFKNGMAMMKTADLARMSRADTISGSVFGFQISFRRDQILALRDLTKRLNLAR